MGLFKHRHRLDVTAIRHARDSGCQPVTVIHWKCHHCLYVDVTDLDGRWVLKPGRGKPTLVPDDAGQSSGLLDGQDDQEAHGMFQELSDALRDRYGALPEVGGQ